MPDFDVKEKRFEQDIEEYLTTAGGYQKGTPKTFDREKALDVGTFVSFIRTSQPKAWERFEKIYGADSERQIVDRFCREVKMAGLLKVLRPKSMRPPRPSMRPTSCTAPGSCTTPSTTKTALILCCLSMVFRWCPWS